MGLIRLLLRAALASLAAFAILSAIGGRFDVVIVVIAVLLLLHYRERT